MSSTLPSHIALIMDGNRRWAVEHGKPKLFGHSEGAKRVKPIVEHCISLGIPYVTFWALSTENVTQRSEKEVEHLFALLKKFIKDHLEELLEKNVRLNIIGDIVALPQSIQDMLEDVVEKSKDNDAIVLTLAINYGGRDEILRAIQSLASSGKDLSMMLTEEDVAEHLDTKGMPDPDLIIRTGGNRRLSGYLPWQSTYAELYFIDTFWPDFTPTLLDDALAWFDTIQRNRGK